VRASAGVRPLDALDAAYLATVTLSCVAPPPPNRAPVAKAGLDRTAAPGEVVTFDGSGSYDPDGQSLTHTWTFGDASPMAPGRTAQHAYTAPGVYTLTLTVSDGALAAVATITVTVLENGAGAGGTFVDGFDRPDSSSLGNGWTVLGGEAGVKGGRLETGAVAGDSVATVPTLHGATQRASAEFSSPDNNIGPRLGILLRVKDARNYYRMYRLIGGTSVLRISRVVEGKETILKQKSVVNPVRNSVFRLSTRADGALLTLELDGVSLLTASDATFAEGAVGLMLGSSGRRSLPADNFSATVE
jgi:PKD repeat protein